MAENEITYGRWTVIGEPVANKVRCRCRCGNEKDVSLYNLRNRLSNSCGCYGAEQRRLASILHGGSNTRLHRIWNAMRSRCTHKSLGDVYDNYGGRGIKVCDEWQDFAVFREWAESHGYDDTLTIERGNVDGDYEPGNCSWIPKALQTRNTRITIRHTAFGETKTLYEWEADNRCKVSANTLKQRIRLSVYMSPEEMVTKPSLRSKVAG